MPDFLEACYHRLRVALAQRELATLPPSASLQSALGALPIGDDGLVGIGPQRTVEHILSDIVPGLSGSTLSSRYYGFVTGGNLPVAEAADNIVSALDQNVQIHLPDQSVATNVEDAALRMLLSVLSLGSPEHWPARTFTTGATAANILGLACAREAVVASRLPDGSDATVAKAGLLRACRAAGIAEIQILTSMPHSSVFKAASVLGLGHDAVKQLPVSLMEPWRLDMDAVEHELTRDGIASIIVVGAGEVNTGRFATNALHMPKLRSLADKYGAWIHVDGAFGLWARALPDTDEFVTSRAQAAGLDLADSIATDGHKLLNVPYDTGVFLCRNAPIATQVLRNPYAAYLSAAAGVQMPSPLNVGLENSRRFRALPVYAVLRSEGHAGIAEMLARMVRLARKIAGWLRDAEEYEWLPDLGAPLDATHIIVLFRAKDAVLNEHLEEKINLTRRMYVSGTVWEGRKACRIAVSSWRVDVESDFEVVKTVLIEAVRQVE